MSTVEATAARRCEVKERLDGMAIKRAVAFGIAIAVLLLCLPVSALAQGSGGATVTGVIKDSSGAVLPGVTVEASSPSLIEKVRTAVSDSSGNYRIIELRPGVYTVTYTLPGFTTLRREGIELSTNFTATLNIDLRVGAVAETVTVTGETPIIDVKGVTREQVISQAMMDALPTSKSMGGLIALVPGAVSPANGLDVGGSKGEQSVRISVHGARTGDMRQMVDGMLFSNLNSDGAGRLYFVNPVTVQENVIDLGTAGSAQYQLGGAVINSIPRDGGNRFSGTAFVAGTGHNLQSNNLTDELRAQKVTQVNGVRDIYDFSGLFGGPVVTDRLWFVASARLNGSTTRSANQFHDANLDDWVFTPNPSYPVDPEERTRSTQIRMTWQASKKDKVTGFYDLQRHFRQQAFGELDRGEAVIESGAAMCHNDSLTQFTWSRPQSQKLLFEGGGTIGLNTFGRPSFGTQLDGSDYERCGISEPLRVLVIDAPAGYTAGYHGFGSVGIGIANQFAGRFSTSVVTGSHTFKVGMNLLKGYIKGNTYRNPLDVQGLPLQYAFTSGVPSAITEFTSQYTEVDLDHDLGLFAQDQWSLGRVTVNAGLRFDWITAHDPTIVEPANALFPSFTAPGVDNVPNWKDLSPRVGVAWDVMGNGKTVIKGGVNRYVTTLTTSVASLFGPAANFSTARNWTDSNKNFFPDCDLKNPAVNGECGAFLNPSVGTFGPATAKPDPDWVSGWGKRGYNWQTQLSVDRQIGSRAAVNVGYYRTIYGNFFTTDNLNLQPSDYDPFCVTVPVDARLPNSGQQVCGLYNARITPATSNYTTFSGNYVNKYPLSGYTQSPETEHFNGVDVGFNARFARGGMLGGGWSVGNAVQQGSVSVAGGVVNSNTTRCFIVDNPQQLVTNLSNTAGVNSSPVGSCNTETPYQNRFRLNSSYTLPWGGVMIAGVYQDLPGANYQANQTYSSAQINAQATGKLINQVTGQPRNLTTAGGVITVDLLSPLTNYAPRIRQLDLRGSKTFKFGRSRLQANVDLYNLFNQSTATFLRAAYTTPSQATATPWLQPTQILDGRLVKFGLQYDF
jgi:hypothetical protein